MYIWKGGSYLMHYDLNGFVLQEENKYTKNLDFNTLRIQVQFPE